MLFSQRYGYKSIRDALQKESIDDVLRTSLWNVLTQTHWSNCLDSVLLSYSRPHIRSFITSIWIDYFKNPLDRLGGDMENIIEHIRDYFFKCKWFEVYDFIEFVSKEFPFEDINHQFVFSCNRVLERESSAYRFVSGRIMEIVSEGEISEIEQAISSSSSVVRVHLQRALELLVDRSSPDYRNSIKESISAVESLCKQVSGRENATLGEALSRIERSGVVQLHGALKGAFSSLYGYTSDAEGIRHSLMSESTLSFEDAKFMLVACSAFTNYLSTKAEKSGVELT